MNSRQESFFKFNFRPFDHPIEGPICYAFGQASLGNVVVGRSQHGICAVGLLARVAACMYSLSLSVTAVYCLFNGMAA